MSAAIAKHRWAFSRNVLGSGMLRLPNASPAPGIDSKTAISGQAVSKIRRSDPSGPNKEKAPDKTKGASSYTGCSAENQVARVQPGLGYVARPDPEDTLSEFQIG